MSGDWEWHMCKKTKENKKIIKIWVQTIQFIDFIFWCVKNDAFLNLKK